MLASIQHTAHRSALSLGIAGSSSDLRRQIRIGLQMNGFTNLTTMNSIAELREALDQTAFDGVVFAELEVRGAMLDAVRAIRGGATKSTPFTTVAVFIPHLTYDDALEVIYSGADDLICGPLQVGTVVERLEAKARSRKDFIVSFGYIGPEHEAIKPLAGPEATRIVPPNYLREIMEKGRVSDLRQDAIDQVIRAARINRLGVDISAIANAVEDLTIPPAPPALERISRLCNDGWVMSGDEHMDTIRHLLGSIKTVCESLLTGGASAHAISQEMRILSLLAKALRVAYVDSEATRKAAPGIRTAIITRYGQDAVDPLAAPPRDAAGHLPPRPSAGAGGVAGAGDERADGKAADGTPSSPASHAGPPEETGNPDTARDEAVPPAPEPGSLFHIPPGADYAEAVQAFLLSMIAVQFGRYRLRAAHPVGAFFAQPSFIDELQDVTDALLLPAMLKLRSITRWATWTFSGTWEPMLLVRRLCTDEPLMRQAWTMAVEDAMDVAGVAEILDGQEKTAFRWLRFPGLDPRKAAMATVTELLFLDPAQLDKTANQVRRQALGILKHEDPYDCYLRNATAHLPHGSDEVAAKALAIRVLDDHTAFSEKGIALTCQTAREQSCGLAECRDHPGPLGSGWVP